MNITNIEFHDADLSYDSMGYLDGGYSAQFTLTVDGAINTGTAIYDHMECTSSVDWDAPVPGDADYAEAVVQTAFQQSVGMEVVCRPVDLAEVMAEVDEDSEQHESEV